MSPNYNDWALPHKNIETGEERGDRRNKQMGFFYQNHYEPDFVCQHERRIGKLGDGGKWICDPHLIVKQEKCLVYSVGSNNDFSFETFVQKDISTNCEIHTFDFGDYAKGAKEAGGVQYHQVGVGIDNPPRFKSIKTLVKELGHENRIIDKFILPYHLVLPTSFIEGNVWSRAFEVAIMLCFLCVIGHHIQKKPSIAIVLGGT